MCISFLSTTAPTRAVTNEMGPKLLLGREGGRALLWAPDVGPTAAGREAERGEEAGNSSVVAAT